MMDFMPAATPLSTGPAAASADADLQHWLDALAGGTCSQDEFVEEVLRREPADPEITWEVLSQLDQYFRRKRIDRETYVCLKSRFQRHSLGSGTDQTMRHTQPRGQDWHAEPALAAPWVDTLDDPVLPEPAADDAENAGPLPDPVEASFHREVRVGDVLCERYRVVDVLQKEDWTTFVEAIDETKVDLPGIRQRVMLQLVDESRSSDPLLVQRVGKLQSLSHPSITRVLDVGEDCGVLVVVQEYFSGVTARELLERGADSGTAFQPATGIVRSLAAALCYSHARGVAHGDLHAGNVLITELGDVRLQGFELRAQHHTVQPMADRLAFARLAHQLLTGTPAPARLGTLSARRRPPGVSRSQWRALRGALEGRGESGADVLAQFGGLAPADEPLRARSGAATTPPPGRHRSHAGEWIAAGIVAAILGTGAYLYMGARQQEPESTPAAPDKVSREPTRPAPQQSPRVVQQAPVVQETAPASIADEGEAAVTAVVVDPPPQARAPPRQQPPPVQPDAASLARPSIDLAANFAWVDTSARVARIWVMRRGSVNREVTFRWWTESGTAEVDRDFRRIDPRVEIIPYGARGIELLVPLMPDPARREPRTFYVKIDEPGPGADLGPRTLMQVAIVPPGYPAARDTTALNLNAP